jgi:type IV secretion system protein TrbL
MAVTEETAVKYKFVLIALCLLSLNANAAINQVGLLDNALNRYASASSAWTTIVTQHASWLFWTLALISLTWTFGFMALKKADIGDFFAEFIRFILFTGFFLWLLVNGPNFAESIIHSMEQVGSEATQLGGYLSPSSIVDIGFSIFNKMLDSMTIWSPIASAAGLIMGGIILVVLALIGINMLILLISGWVLAYGGIFFLGFGGSRWTSDIAINYYKTVLGLAAQLYSMVLIVGIGKTFLDDYYARMAAGLNLKDMAVMVIVAIILLVLTEKIPSMISGIITGAGVGNMSVESGAAIGAAAGAAAAVSMGASMASTGAGHAVSQVGGGIQALRAATQVARDNVSTGQDIVSNLGSKNNSNSRPGAMSSIARTGADMAWQTSRANAQELKKKMQAVHAKFGAEMEKTLGSRVASNIKENAANRQENSGE